MAFLGKIFRPKHEGEGSSGQDQDEVETDMLVSGVYVMHEPRQGQTPELDIVFFHGLQMGDYKQAYKETWESTTASGTKVCWPRDWLSQDFPNARILSISYDSGMLGSQREGKQPIFSLVKGLLDKLMNLVKVGDGRPVVFVGHSLGGLIIKHLCVEMRQNSIDSEAHKSLLHNIKGVFFYATPHGGSSFANLALGTMGIFISFSPVMKFLATNELANVVQLNTEFFKVWNFTKCQTKGLAETKPTFYKGSVVVDLISSSQNALIPIVAINDVDHITICKPKSKNSETYVYLKAFIEGLMKLDANDVTRYPERMVEEISSQGPEMYRMLLEINKCLMGKEEKMAQGKELRKETQLAKELVNRGVIGCIVEVLKGRGRHSPAVVSEAGWVLDNILEYGDTSFFAKAVDAGAVDALVDMLASPKTAPSAVLVLRNLTDQYRPSLSLLATRESYAKLALHNLSSSPNSPSYVRDAIIDILTTMDWTTGESTSYLLEES